MKINTKEIWWCNSHQRQATHIDWKQGKWVCDPKLGGILLPCVCINITGIARICNSSDSQNTKALLPKPRTRSNQNTKSPFPIHDK